MTQRDDTAPMLTYSASTGVPGHWTNPTIYRLDPAKLRGMMWRLFFNGILGILGAFVFYLIVFRLIFKSFDFFRPAFLPMFSGVPFGIIGGVFRVRKMWKTMEVVIADEGILRRGGGFPPLEIRRDEITRFDLAKRRITVRTARPFKFIQVLREFEDFSGIHSRLLSWTEIPASRPTLLMLARRHAVTSAGLCLFIGGMALLLFAKPLWCAGLGIAFMLTFATGVTVRFAQATELPMASRILIMISVWFMPLPMIGLVVLRHWRV